MDIQRIKNFRSFFGSTCSPFNAWLLNRSLETMKIRMEKQAENAAKIADFLNHHPSVQTVHYLGNLTPQDTRNYPIFKKQYSSAGAMISFEVLGGETGAYQFLNHLQLCKLAVSLGSTESLAEHPATMTHAGVNPEMKEKIGITPGLIRLSVGIEHAQDLIADLRQALDREQLA
jgi:methionine-gamma-lyase